MAEKNGWGGKRKGAGRPKVKKPAPGYAKTITTGKKESNLPQNKILSKPGVTVIDRATSIDRTPVSRMVRPAPNRIAW